MADGDYDFDLIVLGGGSGGSAAARRAAFYGKRVALVDAGFRREADGTRRGAGVGGTCVNVGCVPKKLMWQAASLYESVAGPAEVLRGNGIAAEGVGFDWPTLKANRDAVVTRTSAAYLKNWTREGIEVVLGFGRLAGPHAVRVELNANGAHADVARSGATRTITGEHILVCVGGAPKVPRGLPGAELCVTSDGFFDLETMPRKCAVVGAGYIAVEMAGILNALGCETTLFCRGATPLRDSKVFDATIVEKLVDEIRAHGPTLTSGFTPAAILKGADGLTIRSETGSKHGGFDCVLLAIGREPLSRDIGLEAAGVALDKRGYVVVDEYERTSVPSILALGDCTNSGYELTPVAIAAARRLGDRLYGDAGWARIRYGPEIPTVVFSHPPIGMVGLTEAAARAEYGDDAVGTSAATMGGMLYSFNERKVSTTLKIVYVGPERRIVGLHILGPFADEMIQGFAVAVNMGATMRDFNATVCIHPTMSEELISFGGGKGWGLKDGKPERAPYLDTLLAKKLPLLSVAALLGGAFMLGRRCR